MEGKKEHGIFPTVQNPPQTEMWKIVIYLKTFLKIVQIKCGRDFQYPTGFEELLKCGRKQRAWHFF